MTIKIKDFISWVSGRFLFLNTGFAQSTQIINEKFIELLPQNSALEVMVVIRGANIKITVAVDCFS